MFIVSQVLVWIIISTIINTYLMTFPMPVLRKKDYPDNYLIQQNNRIDFQKNNECAAFSTAFLLRHFGIEAEGQALYAHFPSKTTAGTVYPKGIRTVLRNNGFKTNYYKGNINTLKCEVSKGTPVIVFIKTQKDLNHLHFVPVVGYDNDYFYLSDSSSRLANCVDERKHYNRKVPINDFKELWNIKRIHMLFYSNTYIAVDATQSK
ncbi:cysteine peptidase family C39 domain-containing protein [Ureibacillus sinduriensis]|uniref:Peptidase n=1 Tax=Ureibacillus sinduriensis BLB-1 = JCM 15800 TaxID=1384057 RepID=A0A0A3HRC4_9BACL|nr:cysteine peptidase family C39 domain-containing protein [Ureibacillus sinduriensis]KGR74949.1 peptidase [Ureibacillus sinduriensis BLB-1 = JCM 15800]